MPHLFDSPTLQTQLDQNGFVLIDFIGSETVNTLTEFYTKGLDLGDESGFKIGLDMKDKALVKETTNFLKSILEPTAQSAFHDSKIFTASYVVKYPGKEAIVPPHQDWTFTDESKFASYTVWIPLVDTTIENGALCVIPGSHKFFDHPRSSPSPQSKSAIADHMFTLFPYAKAIPMKAGQALIFNNKTIHASPPNVSENTRLAVGIGVVNSNAPLWHYYQSPKQENTLEKYEVDEDFFIQYDNQSISSIYDSGVLLTECKHLETLDRSIPKLSGVEIESLVKSVEGNVWQQDVIDSVASLSALYHQPKKIMSTEESKPQHNEVSVKQVSQTEQKQEVWVDDRTFFKKYTVPNIIAEIKWRLTGKA